MQDYDKYSEPKSAEIITPGLGDIEKVREILFGKNVQAFEARFKALERHIESQAQNLSDRIDERFAALDERLSGEVAQRTVVIEHIEGEVSALDQNLRHTLSELEIESMDRINALHVALDEAQQQIAQEIALLDRNLGESKLSKQSLAVWLNELALKLSQDRS